jgi:AcrR family transcriptional regulator
VSESEKPTKVRRGRPPRYHRDDILAGASTALIERGYGRLRYSDVSQAAGVPTASLQHYFPTVGELRRAALCFTVRDELAQLALAVEALPTPWERITTLIRRSISPEPQLRRRNWTLWLEYWRAAAHEDELAEDSREVGEAWNDLARNCISAGVADGTFRLDGTVDEAAQELQALLDGSGVNLAIEHTEQEAERAIAIVERSARRMLRLDR